uniref:Endonuclease V n=1 Tax=Candidatus Methanogaster sp. ANME-2c ERB4 TaxID=2759911 RepID=A0A7G9Y0G9_9EURY|nr:endonuclease V [Methanosarcinales archaeon ANME-2c ERB4]QNO42026.1 endonuclease V [Methanosarcinales archaeon ANME-2c ERB4]QNO42676.1 endonuclease V [Methanosarcinales archaeon ANME-2c ERB4]QNO43379.1 endonuclease V [Methanosarcinales archaeon ANME-2c ERB4]QNO48219.1 endonuclease V [Methanosarcinales archaeon ANME-2c ERB4]
MIDLFPATSDQRSLLDVQRAVAAHACVEDRFDEIRTIAGVDQAFFDDRVISGIVTLDYRTMEEKARAYAIVATEFLYIPTFLAFREGKAIVSAYRKLARKPELLMIGRCGINHPRSAGLATHIGVALDISTIGVSKNILCGISEQPVDAGEFHPLMYDGGQIGWVLKSKENCNPIIVAPGHRVSMKSSIEITRHCLRGYKLPEPTRQAHIYANLVKRTYDHNKQNHTRQR